MALFTLTAAFALASGLNTTRKLILAVSAVPTAISANAVRIAIIALAAFYVGPQAASGLTHHSIGKTVWILALLPMIAIATFLLRTQSSSLSQPKEQQTLKRGRTLSRRRASNSISDTGKRLASGDLP